MIHDDEKLSRLLRQAGPKSIPKLEVDSHLPARIRARARAGRSPSPVEVPARRWLPISVATAALIVALVVGGYLGYSAGTSSAAVGGAEVAREGGAAEEMTFFYHALSQTGFAEDLVGAESDEAREDG